MQKCGLNPKKPLAIYDNLMSQVGKKGKGGAKKERERNLKIAEWNYFERLLLWKKKNQYIVWLPFLFFRRTYICTNFSFLYWVTYFTNCVKPVCIHGCVLSLPNKFFKKAIMLFFPVERTHTKKLQISFSSDLSTKLNHGTEHSSTQNLVGSSMSSLLYLGGREDRNQKTP